MVFRFLGNAFPIQKIELTQLRLPPWFFASPLSSQGEENYSFPTRNVFQKSVSPTSRNGEGGGNYDLLYQNRISIYQDDLEHILQDYF